MAQPSEQNFANHAKLVPLFHMVMSPILLVHVLDSIYELFGNVTWANVERLLVAIALFILAYYARAFALKAQDRVIRLEERMRYREILPAELAAQASELPVPQIVALRFASDAELPGLVKKVLSGELTSGKEIKKSIVNWRADHYRV